MHKQSTAKVNVLVDKRVKKLVEALSVFPKLQTIESCQGDSTHSAFVCFLYGNSWGELANFVLGYIGKELAVKLGDRVSVSIQVNSYGLPRGELTVRPGAIHKLTKVIKSLSPKSRRISKP
jgi:hypothetical protein